MGKDNGFILNKRNVEALPFTDKGERCYVDENLEGFGVRVGKRVKSFYVEKRVNGKPKRITLGRFPVMSTEEARSQALEVLGKLSKGIDPQEEKRQAERLDRKEQAKQASLAITLDQAMNDYLTVNDEDLSDRTKYDYRKEFRLYLSEWKNTRLVDITETMVTDHYRKVTKKAATTGTNAFKKLRAVFNFAIDHYRLEDKAGEDGRTEQSEPVPLFTLNPVLVLTKTKAWKKKKRRKTVIARKKLGVWFQAIRTLKRQTPFENKRTACDYLVTLILTGMREKECAKLEWQYVDLEMGTITLIEENVKARRQHEIPMTDYLWSLIRDRHRKRSSIFVFPSATDNTKYLTWSRGVVAEITKETGIKFCHHDLRRTFTSIAEYIGLPNFTIKRLLNHAIDSDVTGGYISEFFDDEGLRAPMQRITDFILGEAGLKEQTITSTQYLPIPTADYLKLRTYAKETGLDMEEVVSMLALGLPEVRRIPKQKTKSEPKLALVNGMK